ncbi:MAG: hypothetical protein ABSB69_16970 [Solirubrobacteraceae bacterium]|jgi:hypothetical protein
MSRQLRRFLALAIALTTGALLAAAAVALAAGPVKGAKYTGATVHGKQPISLKVSGSGKSVTVSVVFAPLYCEGGGTGERQITKPAAISSSGAFKGSIAYEFTPEHKVTGKLFFNGKFSGHTVKGTARSEFLLAKQCDGSTSFSAKAGAAAARAATSAHAASSTLRVTSRSWEVGQGEAVHNVAGGGKLEYCSSQPATGLTPIIAFSHAPVGKSYTIKLAGPAASGTIPPGVKTKFTKASGRTSQTYGTPSFPHHKIAGGAYTFSMLVGGKTVASVKLTLDPTSSKC